MYQIAIVTTWHTEESDCFCHETFIETVESLEIPHLAHAALEASYKAAETHFEPFDDFLFGEDVERGYTIREMGMWVDSQTIICNNPETNQLQVIYEKDRTDYHQCWTKPEEDA